MTVANHFADELAAEMPRLMRLARSLTRNQSAAEDLAQDTLVKALRNEHRFVDGTNLWGWLAVMMFRLFVSERRREARRRRAYARLSAVDVAPASQHHSAELREAVEAIGRMPARERAVFRLHAIDGFGSVETAVELGMKPETVRSALSKARASLRASFS